MTEFHEDMNHYGMYGALYEEEEEEEEDDEEEDVDDEEEDEDEGEPKRIAYLRLASGNEGDEKGECHVCYSLVKCSDGNLRLGCRCLIHLSCLTRYIRSVVSLSLNEFWVRELQGFPCPFYSDSSIANECENRDRYILNKNDLEKIIQFADPASGSVDLEFNEDVRLTAEEVAIVSSWLDGSPPLPAPVLEDPYLLATTKKCPNPSCSATIEHFHGHRCHHVTCSSCRTEMCSSCLSTREDNAKDRGSSSACKCPRGSWSASCQSLNSVEDIERYVGRNEFGYPIDIRCGCPICPSCLPSKRCGKACNFKGDSQRKVPRCLDCQFACSVCTNSDCSVCNGYMNPGPSTVAEFNTWVAQTEEQKARSTHGISLPVQNAAMEVLAVLRSMQIVCQERPDLPIVPQIEASLELLVPVIEEHLGLSQGRKSADQNVADIEPHAVASTPAQSIRITLLEEELNSLLTIEGSDERRVNALMSRIDTERQRAFIHATLPRHREGGDLVRLTLGIRMFSQQLSRINTVGEAFVENSQEISRLLCHFARTVTGIYLGFDEEGTRSEGARRDGGVVSGRCLDTRALLLLLQNIERHCANMRRSEVTVDTLRSVHHIISAVRRGDRLAGLNIFHHRMIRMCSGIDEGVDVNWRNIRDELTTYLRQIQPLRQRSVQSSGQQPVQSSGQVHADETESGAARVLTILRTVQTRLGEIQEHPLARDVTMRLERLIPLFEGRSSTYSHIKTLYRGLRDIDIGPNEFIGNLRIINNELMRYINFVWPVETVLGLLRTMQIRAEASQGHPRVNEIATSIGRLIPLLNDRGETLPRLWKFFRRLSRIDIDQIGIDNDETRRLNTKLQRYLTRVTRADNDDVDEGEMTP